MAYLKRETITAFKTKQSLLGVICPQGSLSPLPKTEVLLNFLRFVSAARDVCTELPHKIKEPFCIRGLPSVKALGHKCQIDFHFFLPH